MELNEYNGGATDMDMKRKDASLETMDHIMDRKDHQDFIDQTSLLPLPPEYMRDPHFIMDLMTFPKGSSNPNADSLHTDLQFHNALFPVSADDDTHQNHPHHDTNENRKSSTPPNVYMPLNSDFLMPVSKAFGTPDPVENVNNVKVVQQLLLTETNVALDDAIDDVCDISRFDSRKVLPHKKRISRKLKIHQDDTDLQLSGVPLVEHKLPHVEQLVGPGVQQFRCELCGHATCSQLEFFAHLKHHYEPSTPDNILAAMKTSLEALGPDKNDNANLCTIDKKTDGLDQVFQDVHFPFGSFPQNDDVGTVVINPQHHVEGVDMKMMASNNLEDSIAVATNASIQQQHQPQQTSQNLVPEEFSDTEDMLEGIRDKVLIEDTCDTMDLMTPTSNVVRPHWFTNTCFNGIDLKNKPFCDVLFSGQFAPILNTDQTVPQENHHMGSTRLMSKQLVESLPQAAQHATDLRLPPFQSHANATLNHETQPHVPPPPAPHLTNNVDLIAPQNIKTEKNLDIPPFNTEDTLDANEVEDEHHNGSFHSSSPEFADDRINVQPEDDDCGSDCDEDSPENDGTGKRKRYICDKCQRIFNSCNALKYHYRTHSGLRPFCCDICDKSFFAVGALTAHKRTHTGDKPFQCQHCDRQFRQWGDLKYHTVSIHSNEKNHQCEFCGKAFSRKYSLVVHLRIHTRERNYKCEFCTKTFRASTYLQNHRKIHTGEKPYECELCSKRFRVSGDLRRHRRIHERLPKPKKDAFQSETSMNVKAMVSAPTR